jgi:hypothetical protein
LFLGVGVAPGQLFLSEGIAHSVNDNKGPCGLFSTPESPAPTAPNPGQARDPVLKKEKDTFIDCEKVYRGKARSPQKGSYQNPDALTGTVSGPN